MSQQIDNTSDLFLDGRSVCSAHALLLRTQFPDGGQWCDDSKMCDACMELYWEGYNAASRVYHSYRNDSDLFHEESWKKRWEGDVLRSSNRRYHYWRGYCDYSKDRMVAIQELKKQRESVLEARAKLSRELGPREFTLTYSPSWFESDVQAQAAMRLAIERLTKYYKDELLEFHAVGEYTDAGNSHIHAWYHLVGGRKITDHNFKRAWPHWNPKKKLGRGFQGGHHATISRLSDFAGYIEKHLEEAWLIVDINADQEENNDAQENDSSSQDHSSSGTSTKEGE